MEKYFEAFYMGYANYFMYVFNEILYPSWHNYFYWLIGISVIVWGLEIAFPWRKQQSVIRQDFWLDVLYMFFNFFLFSMVVYNAISDVGVLAFNDFLGFWGLQNLVAIQVDMLPKWSQLLILLVIRDFVQWNIHRLLHRVPWLWEFHKVHHSVEEMGFAAHLRYHWMETITYRSLEYIPLAMIGFGIDDFIIVHLFTLTIGHLNHANIYLPLGPLKYIFNSPQMHLWHHAEKLPEGFQYGINFGITLSIWDYIFGSAKIPYQDKNLKLGFPQINSFPKKFWEQIKYPFFRNTSSKKPL